MRVQQYFVRLIAILQLSAFVGAADSKHLDRYRAGEVNIDNLKSSLSSYPVLGDNGMLRIINGDQSVINYIQLDPSQFHAAAVMQLEFWEKLAIQGDIQEVLKVILNLTELEVDGREVMDEKAL
ncbi:hypothetical protein CC79DRAFT_1371494 [Sarocladium strictum]